MSDWSLGDLADPRRYHEPVDVTADAADELLQALRTMKRIRRAEEVIGDLVTAGEVRCPCHLAIGQEACAAGAALALDPGRDRAFGAHRSHGHYLALGGSLEALFAEIFGRASGCSGGMGGSMHLIAPERGLLGTVPIVGATVPLAVGAALAARLDGSDAVAVAFFGDGAAEEGVVQESLNLAASERLPVLFACENNLFSSHLHIALRQPADRVARFAEAHRIAHATVDGNDVAAVRDAARRLVERARGGEGPGFLEMVTYRWRGHVGPRDDLDVGVRRSDDLPMWRRRDPIARLAEGLRRAGAVDDAALAALDRAVEDEVNRALAQARQAPFPDASATTAYLYTAGRRAEARA